MNFLKSRLNCQNLAEDLHDQNSSLVAKSADSNLTADEMSIDYVLEMAQASRMHSQSALEEMQMRSEPLIFRQFLEDLSSLYEI